MQRQLQRLQNNDAVLMSGEERNQELAGGMVEELVTRGNRRWRVRHAREEANIRNMFLQVCKDHPLREQLSTGEGISKELLLDAHRTMQVKYSIHDAGVNKRGRRKGLGLFAAEDIKANQPLYGNWQDNEVSKLMAVVPYSKQKLMESIAGEFSKSVVQQLTQWCEDNWLTDTEGTLCEMDDNHYVNHSPNPNVKACMNFNPPIAFNGMCAIRDIAAGEEFTENYQEELLDTKRSDHFWKVVEKAAGKHVAQGNGCPSESNV